MNTFDYSAVVAHSKRFRQVSNRYPLQVTYAYGGDIAHAAADDDFLVAATVAGWEREQGLEPLDWVQIGRAERGESDGGDVAYLDAFRLGPLGDLPASLGVAALRLHMAVDDLLLAHWKYPGRDADSAEDELEAIDAAFRDLTVAMLAHAPTRFHTAGTR